MKENNIEEAIERLEYIDRTYSCNNYYSIWDLKCIEILLSDYKRVLKEVKRYKNMYEAEHQIHLVRNEQLDRKQKAIIKCNELENENKELKEEIKSWKKYSDEQEENSIEKNNIICNLEFQIEKLQKENEELKILKSGIQTLQNLGIEDGKYIVMAKTDFLNGSCKHLLDDYISKQEIKNIIDRIDYDIKKTKEIISKNTNIYASYRKNDYQIVRLRAMNTKSLDIKKRLQKLLESKK